MDDAKGNDGGGVAAGDAALFKGQRGLGGSGRGSRGSRCGSGGSGQGRHGGSGDDGSGGVVPKERRVAPVWDARRPGGQADGAQCLVRLVRERMET
jgi:hypothetical protein